MLWPLAKDGLIKGGAVHGGKPFLNRNVRLNSVAAVAEAHGLCEADLMGGAGDGGDGAVGERVGTADHGLRSKE